MGLHGESAQGEVCDEGNPLCVGKKLSGQFQILFYVVFIEYAAHDVEPLYLVVINRFRMACPYVAVFVLAYQRVGAHYGRHNWSAPCNVGILRQERRPRLLSERDDEVWRRHSVFVQDVGHAVLPFLPLAESLAVQVLYVESDVVLSFIFQLLPDVG